eukprot:4329527-Karenia_brevis.AAC.1
MQEGGGIREQRGSHRSHRNQNYFAGGNAGERRKDGGGRKPSETWERTGTIGSMGTKTTLWSRVQKEGGRREEAIGTIGRVITKTTCRSRVQERTKEGGGRKP